MEFYADVDVRTVLLAQPLEELDAAVHVLLPLDVFDGAAAEGAELRLHRIDAVLGVRPTVHTYPVPRRAAEQPVDGHAVHLPLDVPERLIDAARDSRLDRPAAIERAPVNRLPVMHHAAGILPDQVPAHLQRPGGTGLRIVLEHLTPADDARVGGDLDEDPRVRQDEGLDAGDLDVVARTCLRSIGPIARERRVEAVERAGAQDRTEPGSTIHLER